MARRITLARDDMKTSGKASFSAQALLESAGIARNIAEFRYNADQIEKMADGFEKIEVKLWELVLSLRAWRSKKRY